MTTTDTLVRMLNQIAANMAHEPDPVWAVADHVDLFWDPRMKRLIHAHGAEGLSETAAAALARLARADA
jgi:formate dehydrogenase subunit delta